MAKRRTSTKAHVKTIRGVGKRCVRVMANGKWRFVKNSACGLRKKSR